MGLLDDAIREHLELKRLHGAEADELSRLEEEVFSPPSRPGDPDFASAPESGAEEQPGAEPVDQTASDDSAAAEASGAEAGRIEHSNLADTVPHPVTDEEPAVSPEAPPEAPESAIFDAGDDLEIDLELDLDDDLELEDPAVAPAAPDAASDPPTEDDFLAGADLESAFDLDPAADPEAAGAARIDDPLETGEQPAPLILDEPLEEEQALEEESTALEEDTEDEEEGEDLLEGTPEFLKESPDSESLWFEQGKPKDFDFGEDD